MTLRSGVALLLVALVACAAPPRSARTDPTTPAADPAAPPAENPYRLEQEGEAPAADVVFEEDVLDPPESVGAESFGEAPLRIDGAPDPKPIPSSVPVPAPPTVRAPVSATPPAAGQRGFRVQIAALGSQAEADTVAREARSRAADRAYVVHEGGLYKVQVGDFLDRAPALVMRDRCRSLGYSGAWVVTTQVQVVGD